MKILPHSWLVWHFFCVQTSLGSLICDGWLRVCPPWWQSERFCALGRLRAHGQYPHTAYTKAAPLHNTPLLILKPDTVSNSEQKPLLALPREAPGQVSEYRYWVEKSQGCWAQCMTASVWGFSLHSAPLQNRCPLSPPSHRDEDSKVPFKLFPTALDHPCPIGPGFFPSHSDLEIPVQGLTAEMSWIYLLYIIY